MDSRRLFQTLTSQWKLLIMSVVICGLIAAVITVLTVPRYTAEARLFFSVEGGASISDLEAGSQFAVRQMASYAVVATSPRVLDPVAKQLGLPDSTQEPLSLVEATTQLDTVILTIEAVSDDGESAAVIADAVAQQLAQQVPDLAQNTSLGGRGSVTATVLAPAKIPSNQSLPNVPLNIALGLLIGLGIGSLLALQRGSSSALIRSRSSLASGYPPIVGQLPLNASGHTIAEDPTGPLAAPTRRMQTNVALILNRARTNTIAISSAGEGEGKSTVALNLASALALGGASTILVDADVRDPVIHRLTGLQPQPGLTSLLLEGGDLTTVVQRWGPRGLDILTAGLPAENPSEFLRGPAMASILDELRERYDYVVLDSPAANPQQSGMTVASDHGVTLLVVALNSTRLKEVDRALEDARQAGADVRGLVLNKSTPFIAHATNAGQGGARRMQARRAFGVQADSL